MSFQHSILDSMMSGVLVVDLEGRVAFFNRTVEQVLRIRFDDWRGRSVQDLARIAEPFVVSKDEFLNTIGWLHPPHEPRRSQELEFRAGDESLWLREDSRSLRDAQGNVIGRLLVYHDISREKAIDRMKTEFISVASHELRTPMTSIKGSVDLILSGFAGEYSADTHELLEIAQKSCDRLIRLINDILDLAKIEAGQIRLRVEHLPLAEAVHRAVQSVRALAEQNGVRVTLESQPELPLVAMDKDRMEQVVTNLLSNAIKFSPPKSTVKVMLEHHEHGVQCIVEDQGCGIAAEDLEKVFAKFQQVGEKKKGGTGLGLAICQALVMEHGGRIWVESELERGTRFIFRLPPAHRSVGAGA
jgi:PAS domain S-box-containing protein